jgi:hypothetical protein
MKEEIAKKIESKFLSGVGLAKITFKDGKAVYGMF